MYIFVMTFAWRFESSWEVVWSLARFYVSLDFGIQKFWNYSLGFIHFVRLEPIFILVWLLYMSLYSFIFKKKNIYLEDKGIGKPLLCFPRRKDVHLIHNCCWVTVSTGKQSFFGFLWCMMFGENCGTKKHMYFAKGRSKREIQNIIFAASLFFWYKCQLENLSTFLLVLEKFLMLACLCITSFLSLCFLIKMKDI